MGMPEAENISQVLDWVRQHPCDPLVAALRVLAPSTDMRHEDAFRAVLDVVVSRTVGDISTHAEWCEVAARVRSWFDSREVISGSDVWLLLLCSIRYSMGRMTYMPHECVDMYMRYRNHLEPGQKRQIREEVQTELRRSESRGEYLGHDCDHKCWQRLVAVIADEEASEAVAL